MRMYRNHIAFHRRWGGRRERLARDEKAEEGIRVLHGWKSGTKVELMTEQNLSNDLRRLPRANLQQSSKSIAPQNFSEGRLI
jgi:hypothetical protein